MNAQTTDRTISNFIRALRNADIRVSTAETLDALNAVELVGYEDRDYLKRTLSLVLPKTADEKVTFDACFDQFFAFQDVRGEAEAALGDSGDADDQDSEDGGDGEGGGAGSDRQAQPGGKRKKSKSKSKNKNNLFEEEEEEDLGPGEMTDPSSALGKLLMANSRVELTVQMSAAGEAVNIREIQIFTQKGLYARRIMDQMGLADLNQEIADLRQAPAVPARRLGQQLKGRRDFLREQVRDYSGGSTDYGQALLDFKKLCLDDVDNRTTIIILGDARNNFGEAHAEVLKELYDRSKRVIWLNPEARLAWNTGDSEMRKYGAYSHQVEECNSLMHLERVVGNLLRQVN